MAEVDFDNLGNFSDEDENYDSNNDFYDSEVDETYNEEIESWPGHLIHQ